MDPSMSKAFECPICLEVPRSPIYQCTNGHIFCSDCIGYITHCGVCRDPLPRKPIRSLMAEQLAETIAKLKLSKCGDGRLVNYCNILGLKDVLDCGQSIRGDEIVAHMKKHGLNGVNGNKAYILQEIQDFKNPQSWFPVYFKAHDELFFFLSTMQNDLNHESNLTVSWWCVIVGDALEAKKFCLQLNLTNCDKDIKILFNCPVIGYENCTNTASKFVLPFSQLKEFAKCSGGNTNKLEWSINVHIGKKFENANGFQKLENTVVPKVKTFSYATISIPSSSISRIVGSSRSANTNVFLDLAYDNELLGRLVIELRNDVLPFIAENFRCLCTGEKGFGYKGTCFYTIKAMQYIAGGDVTKDDGTGGKSIYGKTFKDENYCLKHTERGILSMNNSGKNTNSSIFMITLKEQPIWDGRYVGFGKVVEGMTVLDDLEKLIMFFNEGMARDKKTTIQNCGQL